MKNLLTEITTFKKYLYAMLLLVILIGVSFVFLVIEQSKYESAIKSKELSIKLAEELRQSSNDLAKLARKYVITGNTIYKEQFFSVLDIREGRLPRPKNYNLVYWDTYFFKGSDENKASSTGEAISLISSVVRAGFTDEELKNLKIAKSKSDILVQVEKEAIKLIFNNPSASSATKEKALMMLADNYFVKMKSEIMFPIIEAERMVTERTSTAINIAKFRLTFVTILLLVSCSLLVILIFRVGKQLKLILGGSIDELQAAMRKLGQGDFLTPINHPANNINVLGLLAQAQQDLAQLNLGHFKAIIESSDDAIISKNKEGIVSSWNKGAENIFGYKAVEMIGKPMAITVPEKRYYEELDILKKISQGIIIDHFETQRLHRDGHVVDLSVTISPIYDNNSNIIGASKIARDITNAKRAAEEIKKLAFYDPLTALANRRLIIKCLDHTLKVVSRDESTYALLFFDIDDFKVINDTYGHDAGDELLFEIAKRLLSTIRESDIAGRFGGDEFILIIKKTSSNMSNQLWLVCFINKIFDALRSPFLFLDIEHNCSISLGAILYDNASLNSNELLKRADNAMYKAKSKGKNTFEITDNVKSGKTT